MEKDFIKDGLDNNSIREIIKNIRVSIDKDGSDECIEKLKKEHSFFNERYPVLFEIATRKEEFNWEYMEYFLMMRNKIIEDELTNEKASVIIGNEWFKKHVNIDENTPPTKFTRNKNKKQKH
jgi:hypothetical protein